MQKSDPMLIRAYYDQYVAECAKARQYYKNEQNKLLYWVGTVFVGIVAATGLFSAGPGAASVEVFGIVHIAFFHAAFTTAFFYFKYKQLSADTFEYLGRKIDTFIRTKHGISEATPLPSYFDIKSHYIGGSVGSGRYLSNIANVLLVLMYIVATVYPITKITLDSNGMHINFFPLLVIVFLGILLVIAEWLYRRERRNMKRRIDDEWNEGNWLDKMKAPD